MKIKKNGQAESFYCYRICKPLPEQSRERTREIGVCLGLPVEFIVWILEIELLFKLI